MVIHKLLPDLSLPKSDCDYLLAWGTHKSGRVLPLGEMHTDSRDKMIFPKLKEIVLNPLVNHIVIDFSPEKGMPTTITLARSDSSRPFEIESIETDDDEDTGE